eukprot:gene10654-7401_t
MAERPAKVVRTENSSSVPSPHEVKRLAEGPFSILDGAIREGYRVFIQCRSQKSLLGLVVAFDKHFNLVLRDVHEISGTDGSDKAARQIKNMFLRGESVIFIVKLPAAE